MSSASSPELAGEQCFQELGLDYAPVQVQTDGLQDVVEVMTSSPPQACVDGPEGAAIHAENGIRQNNLVLLLENQSATFLVMDIIQNWNLL